ncbi:MAG: universal stress protein [Candidatus Eisenbacteria bacterium]|uniref:Universal stress protein n=1 Tax=Eiseniibacteriota bacterium TaxID=2212470 RepID=A0A538THZ1_UNCEI|nr:MAG: universal stress protein [Candidatus Eisenbacteria bacterium]
MKILIALDASPHSEHALQFVSRMRWPAGSRVIVVSALQPMARAAAAGPDLGALPAQVLDDQRRQLEELVSNAESELRESGFATEGRTEVGDPRAVLLAFAQSERADLIVVGSHGRTGIAKLMLGSVSSHVVTHASCSVLVVKHAAAANKTGGRRQT